MSEKKKYTCEATFIRKFFTLFKISLVYFVVNNFLSKVRSGLKIIFPQSLMRRFDNLRQSKNEKEFKKNKLIKMAGLTSNDSIYKCVERVLLNFKHSRIRPNDCELKEILDNVNEHEINLDIYHALFLNGLMKESIYFRNKARDLLKDELTSEKSNLHVNFERKIAAAVECCLSFEQISKYLGMKPSNLIVEGESGFRMYSESIQYLETLNYETFSKILSGNKVTVLGPAKFDSEEVLKSLIDSDVLILTNVLSDSDIIDYIKNVDIKVISYYNSYNAKRIFLNPKLSPGNNVDFSVYMDVNYSYQSLQILTRKARILRKNPYVICGAPQALQSILYDLLRFNPSHVKVCGFTFYASKISYRDGYSTPTERILYDLARHDAIGNFIFAKKIYNNGFFEGDDEVERILNMNDKEYLEALESAFQVDKY